MRRAVNFLRGSVEVEASGPFPERFLNLCAQRGVVFWGVTWLESGADVCGFGGLLTKGTSEDIAANAKKIHDIIAAFRNK